MIGRSSKNGLGKTGLGLTVAMLLAGCAAVPHDAPAVAQVQPTTLGLGLQAPALSERWWEMFGDPQLDRLVDMGLAGNPTLEAAQARVRGAQAQIAEQRAGLLPQIDGDARLVRERFSENYIIPPPFGGTTLWDATGQFGLNWNLDLFGKQKAAVSQAKASASAAALDAATARLMLTTSIAQSYVGLARAERQVAIADQFIQTRQAGLAFVRSRIKHDLATQFDARTAETLLAEAEQAKIRAVAQRETMVHALTALVNRGADFYPQIGATRIAFDAPPTVPDLLPADLLGRRPDILAGQARIDAAVAGRRIAQTDFMPNINITALAGLASLGVTNFFTSGSGQYGGGAAVHLPIFEGGRLRAQYRGATADLDKAVADYDATVIDAVKSASDAITGVRSGDKDADQQMRIVSGLRETVRLDQVRVRTGLGSRLDAVDSGFRLLEAEQGLVDVQAGALTQRVRLIAALGGGFSPRLVADNGHQNNRGQAESGSQDNGRSGL